MINLNLPWQLGIDRVIDCVGETVFIIDSGSDSSNRKRSYELACHIIDAVNTLGHLSASHTKSLIHAALALRGSPCDQQ